MVTIVYVPDLDEIDLASATSWPPWCYTRDTTLYRRPLVRELTALIT